MSATSRDGLAEAIQVLAKAGAVFVLADDRDSLSLERAGQRLDLSDDWLREHLDEFPNAWRLPANGGRATRNVGQLRIPVRDIEAFQLRQKVRRE